MYIQNFSSLFHFLYENDNLLQLIGLFKYKKKIKLIRTLGEFISNVNKIATGKKKKKRSKNFNRYYERLDFPYNVEYLIVLNTALA